MARMTTLALALLLPTALAWAQDDWPMKGHDVRRTGRSRMRGPRQAGRVWRYRATGGVVINMEPTVTSHGVFLGTWGLLRREGRIKRDWNKYDGRIIGLDRSSGRELWSLMPGRTPYAYAFAGRKPTAQDRPAGPGLHLNWYNGTVEGTGAYDPQSGLLFVGRGDGVLYAVDPRSGALRWRFRTLDPARPADPEGGGEIVGGPLISGEGLVCFATFGAPHRPAPPRKVLHETHAVYAVDRSGKLVWRYPATGSLKAPFVAPVALSPDGRRIYAATGLPHPRFPCELLALETATGRLVWRLDLASLRSGAADLAVGAEGRIFLGGMRSGRLGDHPAVFAVDDAGAAGRIAWGPVAPDGELRPASHFCGGVALYEQDGRVRDLYASTAVVRNLNGRGGRLHRLDPRTGRVTATWDPERAEPACQGGLTDVTLDDEGVLYAGVRGRWPAPGKREIRGRMYCLRARDAGFAVLWSLEVECQLDWASPAIGPQGRLFFGSSDRLRGLGFLMAHGTGVAVRGADPLFYGVRD